jgi:carboxylesterase
MLLTDPLFVRGGDTGCLLIHGFSGNPSDLWPLADVLVRQGYTVDVPLLPGHGPSPEGNGRTGWLEWKRAVEQAHDRLAQSCSRVILIGHSMGGTLAIVDAARRMPFALVLLGVPTYVADWRAHLLPLGKYIVRWWYPLAELDFDDALVRERMRERSPDLDLDNPQARASMRRSVRIPTAAIHEFFRLLRYARRFIPHVTAPSLIVHGRLDTTAVPACAEQIFREIASADKQLIWFDASGHQLLTGVEGTAITESIVAWIAART